MPAENSLAAAVAAAQADATELRPAAGEPGAESPGYERPRHSRGTADKNAQPEIKTISLSERQYDFFINHCQKSGQDQCSKIADRLKDLGASVWYDMQAENLTARGMEEGVRRSDSAL